MPVKPARGCTRTFKARWTVPVFERLEQKRPGPLLLSGSTKSFLLKAGYKLVSDFLIMILSWLVKQSLRAFCFRRYSHEK